MNPMSFGEIGAALGISADEAKNIYTNGIRKIRKQRGAMARLRALQSVLTSERGR